MAKIYDVDSEDWIVIETIVKHSIKIFESQYKQEYIA